VRRHAPAHPRATAPAPRSACPARPELWAAHRSGGVVATVLAAASSWLLEPAEPVVEPIVETPPLPRPVIAVFGLARGCGATVVSRALAAELATRDVDGSAAVHCDARAAGIPLATHAAGRLARALEGVPHADTRAVGRLCLVGGAEPEALVAVTRHVAPLVLDAGWTSLGDPSASLADRAVVVGTASVEPALASVAADCLARLGHEPIVVLNRARAVEGPLRDAERAGAEPALVARRPDRAWPTLDVHRLPESRMGAQLALGGREPRGDLGRAIARLADLCEDRQ
jgi:hypothetical protein